MSLSLYDGCLRRLSMIDDAFLTRRQLIKKAVYITPVIVTLTAAWPESAEAKDKDKIDKDKKDKKFS
jgi:hypothetical protein